MSTNKDKWALLISAVLFGGGAIWGGYQVIVSESPTPQDWSLLLLCGGFAVPVFFAILPNLAWAKITKTRVEQSGFSGRWFIATVLIGLGLWSAHPFVLLHLGAQWTEPVFGGNYRGMKVPLWLSAVAVWGTTIAALCAVTVMIVGERKRQRPKGR